MKSTNFKITAQFIIKTSKLNVKIHYESSEVMSYCLHQDDQGILL